MIRGWTVSVDPQVQRLSLVEALALVTDVANRADRVAAGLRALREPQAARLVDRLADMWIKYGDPGDLAAMTELVIEVPDQDG